MPLKELHRIFPNLAATGHRITSPPTFDYNCAGWALHDNASWFEPFGVIVPAPPPVYRWPKGIPNDDSVDAYARLLGMHGYVPCATGDLEDGIEKVAVYTMQDRVTHLARQLPSGMWTSKLGRCEDIEHTLDGIRGHHNQYAYGDPTHFFGRRR